MSDTDSSIIENAYSGCPSVLNRQHSRDQVKH